MNRKKKNHCTCFTPFAYIDCATQKEELLSDLGKPAVNCMRPDLFSFQHAWCPWCRWSLQNPSQFLFSPSIYLSIYLFTPPFWLTPIFPQNHLMSLFLLSFSESFLQYLQFLLYPLDSHTSSLTLHRQCSNHLYIPSPSNDVGLKPTSSPKPFFHL